jgi:hypothetical protein
LTRYTISDEGDSIKESAKWQRPEDQTAWCGFMLDAENKYILVATFSKGFGFVRLLDCETLEETKYLG